MCIFFYVYSLCRTAQTQMIFNGLVSFVCGAGMCKVPQIAAQRAFNIYEHENLTKHHFNFSISLVTSDEIFGYWRRWHVYRDHHGSICFDLFKAAAQGTITGTLSWGEDLGYFSLHILVQLWSLGGLSCIRGPFNMHLLLLHVCIFALTLKHEIIIKFRIDMTELIRGHEQWLSAFSQTLDKSSQFI